MLKLTKYGDGCLEVKSCSCAVNFLNNLHGDGLKLACELWALKLTDEAHRKSIAYFPSLT